MSLGLASSCRAVQPVPAAFVISTKRLTQRPAISGYRRRGLCPPTVVVVAVRSSRTAQAHSSSWTVAHNNCLPAARHRRGRGHTNVVVVMTVMMPVVIVMRIGKRRHGNRHCKYQKKRRCKCYFKNSTKHGEPFHPQGTSDELKFISGP